MNIALDYDGTYTEDKSSWDIFIRNFRRAGHKVYVVTFRGPKDIELGNKDFSILRAITGQAICFTDGQAKKKFCENLGIHIDVWIDDNPDLIIHGSMWKEGDPDLERWRLDRGISV